MTSMVIRKMQSSYKTLSVMRIKRSYHENSNSHHHTKENFKTYLRNCQEGLIAFAHFLT